MKYVKDPGNPRCPYCNYSMSGHMLPGRCPECGKMARVDERPPVTPMRGWTDERIAVLVLQILPMPIVLLFNMIEIEMLGHDTNWRLGEAERMFGFAWLSMAGIYGMAWLLALARQLTFDKRQDKLLPLTLFVVPMVLAIISVGVGWLNLVLSNLVFAFV